MRRIVDNQMEMLTLKNGGRWDIWHSYKETIQQFIKENAIAAMKQDENPVAYAYKDPFHLARQKELTVSFFPPIDFPGGLRYPHLHMDGLIFPLNQAQWKNFSGIMLNDMGTKLSKAGSIGFDSLLDLSDRIGAFI